MGVNQTAGGLREEEVTPHAGRCSSHTVAASFMSYRLRDNMSVDGTKLLFEGFLQKRKDTMKLRWATYWFRLQNTTLFFYTQKNGSASNLRGYYYIYTVQSVREVQRVDSKRFMFEIIMRNGKTKVLAAETAALRKEWVGLLWQAMHLSTSVLSDSRSTHLEAREQRERLNSSSSPIGSHSVMMESLCARPLSAPSGHIQHEVSSIVSPVREETPYQNTLPDCSYQHPNVVDGLNSPLWSSGLSNAEGRQEGDYDILPLRNKVREVNASAEMDEGVYDFPLSYRTADQHPNPTDSIYDVPSALLRNMPDHTLEEQPEDGVYWRI